MQEPSDEIEARHSVPNFLRSRLCATQFRDDWGRIDVFVEGDYLVAPEGEGMCPLRVEHFAAGLDSTRFCCSLIVTLLD